MKYLLLLTLFVSNIVLACGEDLVGQSEENKFLAAVKSADFVYFGKVIRLYRLPDTPASFPFYNGYVFLVDEHIRGEGWDYMEAEQSSFCGVNSPLTENYWPSEFLQEFVVAGYNDNGIYRITAVLPTEKAMSILYEISDAANNR